MVTGGSRGLGLGLVEALVDHGAKVTVVARQSDVLADSGRTLSSYVSRGGPGYWQCGTGTCVSSWYSLSVKESRARDRAPAAIAAAGTAKTAGDTVARACNAFCILI